MEPFLKSLTALNRGFNHDLARYTTSPRHGINGAFSGQYGDHWFNLPKGQALFKVFKHSESEWSNTGNLSIINELLCSRLAAQIGLRCAEYEPAKFGVISGVVSYNILKTGRQADLMLESLEMTFDELKKYKNKGYKFDEAEIKSQLFKAVVFQVLTLQSDAKPDGFVFEVDDQTGTLEFDGLVDNQYAFHTLEFFRLGDQRTFGLDRKMLNVQELIADYDRVLSEKRHGTYRPIMIWENSCDISYRGRVQEICKFAEANKWAMDDLIEVLSNLDIDLAAQQTQSQHQCEIGGDYLSYIKQVTEYGKRQFCRKLEYEAD